MANEITNNIIYKVTVDTKSGKVNIDGITHGFQQADKSFTKLQNNIQKNSSKASKSMSSLSKSTGSAANATMELSRVISDAPYGIRGMANNITQLVSQMGFATKSAGSFKGALREMGKSLMGPMGIVFAVTAVVSALDFFMGSTKKAEVDTRSFKEEVEELNTILGKQADHTILASKTIEGYLDLLKMKREIDKQLNDLDEQRDDTLGYIKNLKASIKTFKDKLALDKDNIFLQKKVIELEGLESAERTKLNNIYVEGQKIIDNYKKAKDDLTKAEEGTLLALEQQKSALQKEQKEVSKTSKKYQEFADKIQVVQDKIDNIKGTIEAADKLSLFESGNELDIKVKSQENALIQWNRKVQDARLKKQYLDKLSEATSEEDKAEIRANYERDRLINQIDAEEKQLQLKMDTEKAVVKAKTKNHVDELKRKYTEFITEVDYKKQLGEISEKDAKRLKGDATGKLFDNITQADNEEKISIEAITKEHQPIFTLFNELKGLRISALFGGGSAEGSEELSEAERLNKFVSTYTEAQEALYGVMSASFDRELTLEQNRTNALNNELRDRLNNESLSADERKSIQLQIARNDENLRKKQEQIQKKQFKMQKAANIANALVNTYASASKAFQNSISNPVNKLLPDGGLLKAKISAGIATAFGLGNVAMISKQKFQSSAGGTITAGALGGGSGSGGGNNREFNFNLAGRSTNNQLAETLQGRFDQPIQTYVVSRDITNQQQLDMDIDNQASFG